jgi:hypothetical protein
MDKLFDIGVTLEIDGNQMSKAGLKKVVDN